jgi:hypothetical protein
MMILSLNIRGDRGAHNNVALKITFFFYKPDLVLVEEIMYEGKKVVAVLYLLAKISTL